METSYGNHLVVNYACSSWIPNSASDIKRHEHLQVSMAISILKAPRNMTKEAMYAELGWSSLISVQDRFRLDFFDRLLSMNNDRWPKLLFNVTYHIPGTISLGNMAVLSGNGMNIWKTVSRTAGLITSLITILKEI